MHTTPNQTDLAAQIRAAEAELRLVALRVQIKALRTLEALMEEPEPTGEAKADASASRERNRRRLAATQALTHARALERQHRTGAKARTSAEKPREKGQQVSGREHPSEKPNAVPPTPSPAGIDLQQDWLSERRAAMAKAKAKRKRRAR